MAHCLVALGANVGDRADTLARAVARIGELADVMLRRHSGWYETRAAGGPAEQGTYLNGVAVVETTLAPHALLEKLQGIEAELGRRRDVRYGPRTIDLDLLLYDQVVMESATLVLPHPRMAFRRFVIDPAAEVAPEMRHPVIGWNMRELGKHLHNALPHVAFAGPAGAGKTRLATRLVGATGGQLISDPLADKDEEPGGPAAGSAEVDELELLDFRSWRLDASRLSDADRLMVSDFWIAQSVAYARAAQDEELERCLRAELARASATIVRPKLIVLLRGASATSEESAGDESAKSRASGDAQIGTLLAALVREPGVGPVLELPAADDEANFAEITAAVTAMGN